VARLALLVPVAAAVGRHIEKLAARDLGFAEDPQVARASEGHHQALRHVQLEVLAEVVVPAFGVVAKVPDTPVVVLLALDRE
jgi:hypothetical protein